MPQGLKSQKNIKAAMEFIGGESTTHIERKS